MAESLALPRRLSLDRRSTHLHTLQGADVPVVAKATLQQALHLMINKRIRDSVLASRGIEGRCVTVALL